MSVITVYALFADDIRVIATTRDADPGFWGTSCFCFAAFSIEIILSCISQPGYFLGFFFWLDLLSTVSLLLDIGWISNAIFNSGSSKGSSSVASLAKASRTSRVGTRAGRIVRVVRLVRLVRLYKHAQLAFAKQAKKFELEQQKLREEQEKANQEESNSHPSSINLEQNHNENDENLPEGAYKTPMIIPFSSPQNQIAFQNNKSQPSLPQLQDHEAIASEKKSRQSGKFIYTKSKEDQQLSENKRVQRSLKRQKSKTFGTKVIGSLPEIGEKSPSWALKSGSLRKSQASSVSNSSQTGEKLANQETRVGKTLSELTTKRVILIVLAVMFSLPIFDKSTYTQDETSYDIPLSLIGKWYNVNNDRYTDAIKTYVDFNKGQRTPLILLQVNSIEYFPLDQSGIIDIDFERTDDLNYFSYSNDSGSIQVTSCTSSRNDNQIDAILSIVRTIFVSAVLTLASMKFTQDVEEYILEPIEKMLEKVKRISNNPLEAAQMEEKEEFMIEQYKEEGNVAELEKIKKTAQYETVVLEKLIIRIGALLALGFGEAGSEIIGQNMNRNGTVDPMLPGNKIMAIFGFCDIRNFTDATEVLQTGVMVFVNEIAQITHGTVDNYLGQANKNIGDAFLLVWKFRDKDYLRNLDGTLEFLQNDITSNYADLSVLAFLKIMAGITLSNKLKKYKKNPGLQARMKGYRVKMGFGLHFGWAIEGAIGSSYKIDASYLSPNVNMASRLEAATKQFGTGLLISGALRDILTQKCQEQLRLIDCVTVKGSIQPIDLYTADANLERLYAKRKGKDAFDNSNFTPQQIKKKKIVDKMIRNQLRADVLKGTKRIALQFDSDPDLKEMRKEYTKSFYDTWEKGFNLYKAGKWQDAMTHIKMTLNWFETRQDGPSQTLFEVMKEHSFLAPKDWKGFRMLTEK